MPTPCPPYTTANRDLLLHTSTPGPKYAVRIWKWSNCKASLNPDEHTHIYIALWPHRRCCWFELINLLFKEMVSLASISQIEKSTVRHGDWWPSQWSTLSPSLPQDVPGPCQSPNSKVSARHYGDWLEIFSLTNYSPPWPEAGIMIGKWSPSLEPQLVQRCNYRRDFLSAVLLNNFIIGL